MSRTHSIRLSSGGSGDWAEATYGSTISSAAPPPPPPTTITTPTKPTTVSSPPLSSAAPTGPTVTKYGQCGGQGWTGA